jgi:hypothetical protein
LRINTSSNGLCSEQVLPVELLSFNAQCNERFIDLSWEVAGESEIKGYEVERSTSAVSWEKLETVLASATQAVMKRYAYRDFTRSANEQNFYRLKILEADGTYRYSDI